MMKGTNFEEEESVTWVLFNFVEFSWVWIKYGCHYIQLAY